MPRDQRLRPGPSSGRDRPRHHHAGRHAAAAARTPGGSAPARSPTSCAIARAADRLGYHHLTCSEHVAMPVDVAETRGGRYWDPLADLRLPRGASPRRIRLRRDVARARLPPPARDREALRHARPDLPAAGSCSASASARCEEEFDAARRAVRRSRRPGRRRAPRAPRRRCRRREPEYHGNYYDFRTSSSIRAPCRPACRSGSAVARRRSLRRAVELGRRLGAVRAAHRRRLGAWSSRPGPPTAWAAPPAPARHRAPERARRSTPQAEPDRVAEPRSDALADARRDRARRPLRAPLPRALHRADGGHGRRRVASVT